MKANSFLALLAGAAVGVVLGILIAPEKGEETRKKVKKTAEDCIDKVKEKFDDMTNNSESADEEAEAKNPTENE
jgi:gas vesicle protein